MKFSEEALLKEVVSNLLVAQICEFDRVIRDGILAAEGGIDLPPAEVIAQFGRIEVLASGARRFVWRGKVVAVQLPIKLSPQGS